MRPMIDRDRPAWRTDAKWISGILLVLALAALTPIFGLSRLSARENALPIIEDVLASRLLPGDGEDAQELRVGIETSPSGAIESIPGSNLVIEPDELADLTAAEAAARAASELARRVVASGAEAAFDGMEEGILGRSLRQITAAAGSEIVRATLLLEMLPEGLGDGRRLANWRLQAERNPGEPVQPIVGVFVRLPVSEVEQLSARGIGERVVTELADTLLAGGLPAARELVSNQNLLRSLEEAAGPVTERLETLFAALLISHESLLDERLQRAREALQARAGSFEEGLALVDREELAGLSVDEANRVVLERLAVVAHRGGARAAASELRNAELSEEALAAAPFIDALAAHARDSYLRLTWLLAGLSAVLLLALIVASRGWGRLANPGLAMLLAGATGALLLTRLEQIPVAVSLASAGPAEFPAQDPLSRLLLLVVNGSADPAGEVFTSLLRNQLALGVVGLALVVLSIILLSLGKFGRRRRSLI